MSQVTGAGLSHIERFLNILPPNSTSQSSSTVSLDQQPDEFHIDEIFANGPDNQVSEHRVLLRIGAGDHGRAAGARLRARG